MSPGVVFVRAFRPSTLGESEQDAPFHDMTRLANIERYARMVSEGLRLFEEEGTVSCARDSNAKSQAATLP